MLLSGETLWADDEPKRVCESVLKGGWSFDAECWQTTSPGAKELIRCMLDTCADTRLTAFAVCCSDWVHLVGGPSTRKDVASPRDGSKRRSRAGTGSEIETGSGSSVVYSHAMMRSSTFQERLAASSGLSGEAEARLSLLSKREYLHLHVSALVNFCADAADDAASLDRTRATLSRLLATAVGMARRLCHADRGSLFLVVHVEGAAEPQLWSKVAECSEPIVVQLGHGLAGACGECRSVMGSTYSGRLTRCRSAAPGLSGDALNVADAYVDGRFDRSHDLNTGYCLDRRTTQTFS